MNYALLDNTGKVASQRGGPYEGYVKCPDWVQVGDLFDGQWHQNEERRVASIKAKAQEIIYSKLPQWKQNNLLARHAEIQSKLFVMPMTELSAEKAKLEAIWSWVKAVRAESDRLEADPNATPNWPTYE